jgi:hypothetical protein
MTEYVVSQDGKLATSRNRWKAIRKFTTEEYAWAYIDQILKATSPSAKFEVVAVEEETRR